MLRKKKKTNIKTSKKPVFFWAVYEKTDIARDTDDQMAVFRVRRAAEMWKKDSEVNGHAGLIMRKVKISVLK